MALSPATLLLVAHGSSEPAAAEVVEELLRLIRRARPDLPTGAGYLDHGAPTLIDAVAALRGPAVVVPLLLAGGYHARVDIPRALAGARHPVATARPLGPDPRLCTVIEARLGEAGVPRDAAIVLAAAGSTDPAACGDVVAQAGFLAHARGTPVLPAFATAASPTVAEALAELRRAGHPHPGVARYLIGPGRFAEEVATAAQGRAAVGAPLGACPAVVEIVLSRYDETPLRPR